MRYKVWVCLEAEYDDIEADSEEEAFLIASEAAMSGGSWDFTIEEVEDSEGEESVWLTGEGRRRKMPVRKVKGGYRYGKRGKVYKTKAKAERQGRAVHAAQARRRKKK